MDSGKPEQRWKRNLTPNTGHQAEMLIETRNKASNYWETNSNFRSKQNVFMESLRLDMSYENGRQLWKMINDTNVTTAYFLMFFPHAVWFWGFYIFCSSHFFFVLVWCEQIDWPHGIPSCVVLTLTIPITMCSSPGRSE